MTNYLYILEDNLLILMILFAHYSGISTRVCTARRCRCRTGLRRRPGGGVMARTSTTLLEKNTTKRKKVRSEGRKPKAYF